MKSAWLLPLLLCIPSTAVAARDKGAQVDALFRDYAGRVPGASVLVLHHGKVVLRKSYGLASLEESRKAAPRTSYRLASVTKQFTATAVLLLAERAQLSLDDPLTKLFPHFPRYGQQITVRHLLNHTSGLLAYEDLMPEGTEPVLDTDVLQILQRQNTAYFAPGTQFRYSNSGYALLALIVEKVSGLSFPEFLQKNIFQPLGMRGTYLNLRPAPRDAKRAYGYTKRGDAWERTDQSRTSYVLGDGGVYSSVEDLAKWVRALDTARLLPAVTLQQAMSPSTPARALSEDRAATQSEERLGYGFGWFVSRYHGLTAVWHGGSSIGFRNHLLRIPEKDLTVILLTNRNDGDTGRLARQIADLYLSM